MPTRRSARPERRAELRAEIARLTGIAVFGTISATYRTCGTPGCRCHGPGPKHGPHLYVSYRGAADKTTGYYVPQAAQPQIRAGIAAWRRLQELLRALAELNKDRALASAPQARGR